MNGYEERRAAFEELGVSLFAASVYNEEQSAPVADPLGYPVGYGVTREQGDAMGSWWDEERDFIQPSEFLISSTGKVLMSTYSNSPIGRMDPAEMLTLLTMMSKRQQ
ncbi:MAG: hypothetical protein AAF525_15300 [Pseudomonadota bacterium]